VWALAKRTFRKSIESPIAYLVAFFFYGVVGIFFGITFFVSNQASIDRIGDISSWIFCLIIPGLTMGLISDEISSGTFEQLSTLPVRDEEIVLGKFIGFAMLSLVLVVGLLFYPLVVSFLSIKPIGLDWGATLGTLASLYALALVYGAMGLYASSLARNQVVALIIGMIFCTFFLFIGQFYAFFPGFLSRVVDFLGVVSHLTTLGRGVWDIRDLFYFGTLGSLFLYFTVLRLSSRRF
jgi:ABC-2 type transport system permease protein